VRRPRASAVAGLGAAPGYPALPMSRRSLLLVAVLLCVAAVLPAAASASTPPPAGPTVPAGVTAGGIDLSGATLEEARIRLETGLAPRINQPFVLTAAGRRWTLSPERAKLQFDAETTAKRALRAKQPGEVPLKLSHSKLAVREWVAAVAKRVRRPGRDASVKIGLRRITIRRAVHGKELDEAAVAKLIDEALDDPAAPRAARVKLRKVAPAVTVAELRRRYSTVITISKSEFKLRLFKNLKWVKTYRVAIGAPGYETPSGRFSITNKQVNPNWYVPNSPWAGELRGTVVQGGAANNPLKARWMGIVNGVGIHGTGETGSIGTRASHGCIRMTVPDVIDLYRRVPVGTPVLIR